MAVKLTWRYTVQCLGGCAVPASCLISLCSADIENLVLMRIMLPPWDKAMILLTLELRLPSDHLEMLMLWNQQAKRGITEVFW